MRLCGLYPYQKMKNIIDLSNGTLKISDEVMVSPNMTFDNLHNLAPQNSIWDVGNGYKWIYFSDIKIGNYYFYFRICFYKNTTLYCAEFDFYNQPFPEKWSWENWSEEKDLRQIKMYNKYLLEIMGATNKKFAWGTISSYYDRRSYATGIGIKYKL